MKKLTKRALSFAVGFTLIAGTQFSAVSAASKTAKVNLATGLGVDTSVASSANAKDDKTNGKVQVDSLIAVITVDTETGKIVKCDFDAAQTVVNFDIKGVVKSDKTAEILTKMEKGDAYGMRKNSEIGAEWFEQAEAFAEWAVGKTPEEVTSLKTKKVNDAHPQVPDDADLTSSVTITVGSFLTAVEKAAANLAEPADVTGEYTTGLGVVTSIGSSTDAKADANGRGQVDTIVAAVTLDSKGVIVQCSIDSAQTRVAFDAKGAIATDLTAEVFTKTELEDKYGMKKNSGIDKEWYEQIAAFEEWVIAKLLMKLPA